MAVFVNMKGVVFLSILLIYRFQNNMNIITLLKKLTHITTQWDVSSD